MHAPETVNAIGDFSTAGQNPAQPSQAAFGSPTKPQNHIKEEIKEEPTDLTAEQFQQL